MPAPDARQVPLSKVDKLRADAADAAAMRAFHTHPDVVALRVERIRSQVDTLLWTGIVLGLGFTMVNVQSFAARTALVWSLPWLAAWLLDPMVSLVLIAVLRAEQVTARYQVPGMAGWVRTTKVFAFAATYLMNTWQSWRAVDAAGIVLHSVPPLLVYCAAEAGPIVRDRLTEAVLRAAHMAATTPAEATATGPAGSGAPVQEPAPAVVAGPIADPAVNAPAGPPVNPTPAPGGAPDPVVRERRTPARRTRPGGRRGKQAAPRKLRADYLAEARAAWTPGTEVTPAWVREVTDCSRGMSSAVAADLNAALIPDPASVQSTPDTTADTAPVAHDGGAAPTAGADAEAEAELARMEAA
jgi:hypothetical protein